MIFTALTQNNVDSRKSRHTTGKRLYYRQYRIGNIYCIVRPLPE